MFNIHPGNIYDLILTDSYSNPYFISSFYPFTNVFTLFGLFDVIHGKNVH